MVCLSNWNPSRWTSCSISPGIPRAGSRGRGWVGRRFAFTCKDEAIRMGAEEARYLRQEGYASSEEHLWDELRRIDQLVRAQTVRWLYTIGQDKDERSWG